MKISKEEMRQQIQRISFLDCLAVKQASNGASALLQRKVTRWPWKKLTLQRLIRLPSEREVALDLIKNQGFSLVEIRK
jgi:hypothetical protein